VGQSLYIESALYQQHQKSDYDTFFLTKSAL
jgi:hypothetical protein